MKYVPLVVLIATIWAYWLGVAVMVVRVHRHKRKRAGVIPEKPIERLMWLIWVPLVAAWIYLPYAALKRSDGPFALPAFAHLEPYESLRIAAAACGVVALAVTIRCWSKMGDDWRMDIGERRAPLITDGPFRLIRHPIYAFSMLLMICSAIVVPTAAMLGIAAIHLALMNVKARNEEQHLSAVHGDSYRRYLERTGRFFPRLFARES